MDIQYKPLKIKCSDSIEMEVEGKLISMSLFFQSMMDTEEVT